MPARNAVNTEGYNTPEPEPRYHVMVSQPGCLPDYHSGEDGFEGFASEGEARAEFEHMLNDLLEQYEDDNVSYVQDGNVAVVTFGSYGSQRIVEIVPAE